MKNFASVLLLILIILASCSKKATKDDTLSITKSGGKGYPNSDMVAQYGALKLEGVSNDPTIGYTESNPILVSDGNQMNASKRSSMYLNALRDKDGKRVYFERIGSCCPFKNDALLMGGGLLDKYLVRTEDGKETVLYVNMYLSGKLLAPVGFFY